MLAATGKGVQARGPKAVLSDIYIQTLARTQAAALLRG